MTTNQPPTIEERLSRLETLFTNVGETVLAQNNAIAALGASVQQTTQNVDTLQNIVNEHNATIDVLVANIQQLTENVTVVTNRVDMLAIQAEQDRAQAALDRQEFRNSINQILNYLRDRNGGSPPPQQ
ncbi:MAG: hypothetical protein SAK29_41415 [Scytonema sp. PMC 1069.18]|nr:hypothetical protein [Scytonema sp. PMC 1069.18]MEC4886336.1 hypothetical protein [Scytonema sp. PMC 1070.18]